MLQENDLKADKNLQLINAMLKETKTLSAEKPI